jgi:hypothetical protein
MHMAIYTSPSWPPLQQLLCINLNFIEMIGKEPTPN